ncbi:MAG: tRNA dihydrouridine(20/20a) synthase DusA [Pelagibacteraceae bacterium]|nr:tRNA dihydrouridine(20/20a) synthase DusA [Pelagibacteraceae bacterium]|tara:strand:- start:47398 stop:48387 length:990 start_codon:yes stop_codon:yes gene_type:complete
MSYTFNDRKFCIAPMMGYTTPYARNLYRILSKKAFIFTEMIAANTMIYSKNTDSIIANINHNPIALQVGGSKIQDLKKCSKIAYELDYNEINLNVGCPSKAVQKGCFGVRLMENKTLVRECLESMQINKNIEVSIKCRIGIGEKFNYDYFEEFIDEIIKSGVKIIYIHARNAILTGINPKGNRTIPPLNYDFVKEIKVKYPNITFILNGGINSIDEAFTLSKEYDGVMLGRLIQNNPFCLKDVDRRFFGTRTSYKVDEDTIHQYFQYIQPKIGKESIFRLLSPLLNIFFGVPKSKEYKIKIHQNMKSQKLDFLEKIFIDFIRKKNAIIN